MAGRVDIKFIDAIPPELICYICKKMLFKPQWMNCCGQQFCKDCLEIWLSESSRSCPHCRATGFSYMHMKQKEKKIGELKVYCANKQHGCDAVLKYADFHNHLSATNKDGCPYTMQSCPNKCNTKAFRCKMAEHMEKLCIKRIVPCKHCKTKGEYQLLMKHESNCPSRPMACPQRCGAQILAGDLQDHKESCAFEVVPCTYSEMGCPAQLYRKNIKLHIESIDHTGMMVKSMIALREGHKRLQEMQAVLTKAWIQLQGKYTILAEKHAVLECKALHNGFVRAPQRECIKKQVKEGSKIVKSDSASLLSAGRDISAEDMGVLTGTLNKVQCLFSCANPFSKR